MVVFCCDFCEDCGGFNEDDFILVYGGEEGF